MLQEATKALNSAFNNSFIKKISQYLHDCVREEVKSSTFRNLKGDKDNKWIFLPGEEELFTQNKEYISLDGKDSKLTELMLQSELGSKDKYLIYGYLFLVGKSNKSKRQNEFLTPLLYMPCKLERNGVNINCLPLDEVLSLNTGALAALMRKSDDEDETDIMLGHFCLYGYGMRQYGAGFRLGRHGRQICQGREIREYKGKGSIRGSGMEGRKNFGSGIYPFPRTSSQSQYGGFGPCVRDFRDSKRCCVCIFRGIRDGRRIGQHFLFPVRSEGSGTV